MNECSVKHSRMLTNPENLVKVGPWDSVINCLEVGLLKVKNKRNRSRIYSRPGRLNDRQLSFGPVSWLLLKIDLLINSRAICFANVLFFFFLVVQLFTRNFRINWTDFQVFSSLATFAWRRHALLDALGISTEFWGGDQYSVLFHLFARGHHCYATRATR